MCTKQSSALGQNSSQRHVVMEDGRYVLYKACCQCEELKLLTFRKEGETGRIVLHQGDADKARADAELIGWMIYYFYHLDYLEPPPTGQSSMLRFK